MRDVDRQLITAIQSRNVEGIKAAIQAGANLEASTGGSGYH